MKKTVKKNERKYLLIALLITSLLVFGGLLINRLSTKPTPSNSDLGEFSTYWRTYTDQKYKFSFEHPPVWWQDVRIKPITTRIDEEPVILIHDRDPGLPIDTDSTGPAYPAHYIGVTSFAVSKTIQEFINDLVNDFSPEVRGDIRKSLDQKEFKINKIPALSFNEPGSGGRGRVIIVSDGKQVILFSFPYQLDYTKDLTITQILSTFKFTN